MGAAPSHQERTPRSRSAHRGRVGVLPEPTLLVASPGGSSASGRTGDKPKKGGSGRESAFLGRWFPERRAEGDEGLRARRPRRIRGETTALDGTWNAAARWESAAPAALVSCLIALRKEEKVFTADLHSDGADFGYELLSGLCIGGAVPVPMVMVTAEALHCTWGLITSQINDIQNFR